MQYEGLVRDFEGLVRDVTTYCAAINACEKGQLPPQARRLLQGPESLGQSRHRRPWNTATTS